MYRARTRACPGCRTPMREVPLSGVSADVDVCDTCDGAFLEFFDGEPVALAQAMLSVVRLDGPVLLHDELVCPDCVAPMPRRAYLEQGPDVPRCETCLAVFLDPALLEELARTRFVDPDGEDEESWFGRLMGAIFGRG
ncbi:MAG: zf-TFIIB domain-containing protein [Sandaracinaceae bacterium]